MCDEYEIAVIIAHNMENIVLRTFTVEKKHQVQKIRYAPTNKQTLLYYNFTYRDFFVCCCCCCCCYNG